MNMCIGSFIEFVICILHKTLLMHNVWLTGGL